MNEWVSVKTELPECNEAVYVRDIKGSVFGAIYFGPSVGWVKIDTRTPAKVTHWAR